MYTYLLSMKNISWFFTTNT